MPKGFVPLFKTALNIQGPAARISKVPVTFLACVASVSNRVIARKLERKQKNGLRGRGRGEKVPSFPSPSPVIHFFCFCPSFLDESREETLATQAMTFRARNNVKKNVRAGSGGLTSQFCFFIWPQLFKRRIAPSTA